MNTKTGKRFELHFTMILGFDSPAECLAAGELMHRLSNECAEAIGAPGYSLGEMVDHREPGTVEKTLDPRMN